MNPCTSALMKSSSHCVIEMMCQRPSKGDFDFGFAFAIVHLPFCVLGPRVLCLWRRWFWRASIRSDGVRWIVVIIEPSLGRIRWRSGQWSKVLRDLGFVETV